MASSPKYKVYDAQKDYQACAKDPHAAAILAEHYGGTVRYGHSLVVWQPGDISPSESLDAVTGLIIDRVVAIYE